MRYGSVCSGIEAATSAWHSLGWTPQWFSEIEPFPSAVLAHHYPNVPNFGDMTKFKEWKLDDSTAIDVLVGGTPCQSFSVAGLRKGLDDPRGNLMLTYLAIANKYRPNWLVWENVPGVLSSNGGNDFACLLRGMGELGYGFAYRILDAQYFGVAQRRRRVFVVGCLGDWRAAAAVLFERHSLSGHPAPSREKRQEVAGTIGARTGRSIGAQDAACGDMISWPPEIAPTLNARYGEKMGLENQHIDGGAGMFTLQPIPIHAQATNQPIALAENTIGRQPLNGGNGDGFTVGGPMYTLNATGVHGVAQPIPFDTTQITSPENGSNPQPGDPCHPLTRGGHTPAIHKQLHSQDSRVTELKEVCGTVSATYGTGGGNIPVTVQPVAYAFDSLSSNSMVGVVHGTQDPCVSDIAFAQGRNNGGENVLFSSMAVRRLTPVECERLQGFTDNHTNIPWRKKPESPDGPRYKALGNSMAVPVMHWIGKRIQMVEDL
jgi:DNA (cytosine-5)-methyltransferase 1